MILLTDTLLNISPMWAKASSHVRMFGAGNKLQPASLHAFQKGPRLQEIPAAPLPRAFSVARFATERAAGALSSAGSDGKDDRQGPSYVMSCNEISTLWSLTEDDS